MTVSLEDTTEGLLDDLPRVLNEVQSLKQEAELLKDQMNDVKSDITKVNLTFSHIGFLSLKVKKRTILEHSTF